MALPNAINLTGLDASKPAFGIAGRLYFATDTLKVYYDTGAAWTGYSFGAAGNTLLAAVPGTDGATATVTTAYVAFSTPWITPTLVLAGITDIIVDVQVTTLLSQDTGILFAIMRSGTQIYNTGICYPGGYTAQTTPGTFHFSWVDKAVVAGSYTYEVRVTGYGSSTVVTLKNAIVTTGIISSKGGSMLSVSSAPNV